MLVAVEPGLVEMVEGRAVLAVGIQEYGSEQGLWVQQAEHWRGLAGRLEQSKFVVEVVVKPQAWHHGGQS